MKIGIDIDGVINNLAAYYIECGTKYCYENNINTAINTSEYKPRDIFGWNHSIEKDFHEKYYKEFILENRFLRINVVEVMQKLHMDHELFLITARTDKDVPSYIASTMKDITSEWLSKNNIPFDHLIFSTVDKTSYINRLMLDWMIEDNPLFFDKISLLSCSTKFICYDAFYNQKVFGEHIIRAFSWYDILNIIQRQK